MRTSRSCSSISRVELSFSDPAAPSLIMPPKKVAIRMIIKVDPIKIPPTRIYIIVLGLDP
jgi:hypothetical protein